MCLHGISLGASLHVIHVSSVKRITRCVYLGYHYVHDTGKHRLIANSCWNFENTKVFKSHQRQLREQEANIKGSHSESGY